MDKPKQNWRKRKESFTETVKSDPKSIIIGSIIATFIGISPYLFYLYDYNPSLTKLIISRTY